MPPDLEAFYHERVRRVADFLAIVPVWNEHVGWRTEDRIITRLLHAKAVPVLSDGCGSLFGLDISDRNTTPAVYFFDHEDEFSRPRWAAGSSLARFLLLIADQDHDDAENWPQKWELGLDPDIERCPRAPAIWVTG